MLCPACKDTTLAMTERQGIEIDYCPNCRGIWLDRGELDRLIERAEREAAPAMSPPPPPSSSPLGGVRAPGPAPGHGGAYGGYREGGEGGERGRYREGGEGGEGGERGYGGYGGERGHSGYPGGQSSHAHRKKKSLLGDMFDF